MPNGYEQEQSDKRIEQINKFKDRIKELEAEIREVSNQLYNLYKLCSDTTSSDVYGTILGLHERLEQALKG